MGGDYTTSAWYVCAVEILLTVPNHEVGGSGVRVYFSVNSLPLALRSCNRSCKMSMHVTRTRVIQLYLRLLTPCTLSHNVDFCSVETGIGRSQPLDYSVVCAISITRCKSTVSSPPSPTTFAQGGWGVAFPIEQVYYAFCGLFRDRASRLAKRPKSASCFCEFSS